MSTIINILTSPFVLLFGFIDYIMQEVESNESLQKAADLSLQTVSILIGLVIAGVGISSLGYENDPYRFAGLLWFVSASVGFWAWPLIPQTEDMRAPFVVGHALYYLFSLVLLFLIRDIAFFSGIIGVLSILLIIFDFYYLGIHAKTRLQNFREEKAKKKNEFKSRVLRLEEGEIEPLLVTDEEYQFLLEIRRNKK